MAAEPGDVEATAGSHDEHDREARDAALARLGTSLGGYRLVALLGSGGTAAVYRGVRDTGEVAAIKVLHAWLAADRRARRRFLREAAIVSKLAHPAIVPMLAQGEDADGTAYLVMELAEGQTLEAWRAASGGRLALDEVLRLIEELLDVLTEAHAHGVIHRDIKPANLLLTASGRLRVLDFGIARATELTDTPSLATRTGAVLGTVFFMAPEQALGVGDEIDARSDVWAVGATMFTLLTGRFVHPARTVSQALVLAATQPAPPIRSVLADVPVRHARVIDQALAFARDERHADAGAMRAALRRAAHGEADAPPAATVATLPEATTLSGRAVPRERRPAEHAGPAARRGRAWTVLSLAVGGAALVAVGLFRGLDARPDAPSPSPAVERGAGTDEAVAVGPRPGDVEPGADADPSAPTEVFAHTWGAGWTSFMPFRLNGWPHQIDYNASTGRIHLDRYFPGARGTDSRWYSMWDPGWTHFTPLPIGDAAHFVAYAAATGAARFYRVRPELDGCDLLSRAQWPAGMTHVVPFTLAGEPHLMLYDSATGALRHERVGARGDGSTTAFRGSWDAGWTSLVPHDVAGAPHLIAYRAATGLLNFDRVPPGLDGMIVLGSDPGSVAPGGVLAPLVTATRTCFSVHHPDGSARIDCVDPAADGSHTVWTGRWLADATSAIAFEQAGDHYQVLYDRVTGAVRSYRLPRL